MNCCVFCTLLFDAEPTNVGRSETNPDICILCAEDLRRRNRMKTRVEPITGNRYILEFDSEVELQSAIADTRSLLPTLRSLLIGDEPSPITTARPAAKRTYQKRAEKKTAARRVVKPVRKSSTVPCQYCARPISTRQITNHERKCAQRPAGPSED
jgi:hypothetical protein